MTSNERTSADRRDHDVTIGLARAFGGAIIFSVPALMTMELWWLGFHIDPLRLALLLLVSIPFLTALSFFGGFEETLAWKDDLLDAFVALAVGSVAATIVLSLFAIIGPGMSADEIVGKIAVQTFPCAVGAVLAESMLGQQTEGEREKRASAGYFGELFHMAAGAIFLSLSLAPTEEMVLIAYKMSEWHVLALIATTLMLMHAFIYAVDVRGEAAIPEGTTHWTMFAQFTIVAYAVSLAVSLYILWTFGRLDGMEVDQIVRASIVLGFPSAIGAAAARLLL